MKENKDIVQTTFDFNIVQKVENFNVTVDEIRTGFYAPLDRIVQNSELYIKWEKNNKSLIYENAWGKVKLLNVILTQKHRDLLDSIIINAKRITQQDDGSVEVLFSRKKVLEQLGHTQNTNYTWLNNKIREIGLLEIELESDGEKRVFRIINERDESELENMGRILFSPRYMKLYNETTLVNYKDEIDKLLALDSGLLKAIVRFFWTHKNISISIVGNGDTKGLLETIHYPISSDRQRQRALKEIRDNAGLLLEYGIIYEEDKENKITYLKNSYENTIKFLSPAKQNDTKQKKLKKPQLKDFKSFVGRRYTSIEDGGLFDDGMEIIYEIQEVVKDTDNTYYLVVYSDKKGRQKSLKSYTYEEIKSLLGDG